MKRKNLISGVLLIALGLIGIAAVFNGQTSAQFPDQDKNGKPLIPRPNPFVIWSPTDLGHNAVTLPATSGATSNTNIVPTGGATALTYFVSCTQPYKVTVNTYTADDIAKPQPFNPAPNTGYTLYGSYDLTTGITTATGAQQVYIGTELAPTVTSGTLGIAFRLPQAAISFSEAQTGATPGTCTSRLIVKYN